jgi:hypothetical protein
MSFVAPFWSLTGEDKWLAADSMAERFVVGTFDLLSSDLFDDFRAKARML